MHLFGGEENREKERPTLGSRLVDFLFVWESSKIVLMMKRFSLLGQHD